MIYKCEICRQTYIMEKAPQNCPFCGSFIEHIKPIDDVPDIEKYELSNISRDNIVNAIKKEFNAYALYNCITNKSKNIDMVSIFSVMATNELWHYKILSKELNIEGGLGFMGENELGNCSQPDETLIINSKIAEAQTIIYYKKGFEEAIEPRIQLVFEALQEVEQMHLGLLG